MPKLDSESEGVRSGNGVSACLPRVYASGFIGTSGMALGAHVAVRHPFRTWLQDNVSNGLLSHLLGRVMLRSGPRNV